jgi:hypothetical protein
MAGRVLIATEPLRIAEADGEIQRLAEYWNAHRTGRIMPVRRDLDVLDLGPWLGRLSLYEVLGDGDMLIRVRGSTMCTVPVPNHNSDGLRVSQTKPQCFAEMGLRHYRETYDGAAPTCYRIELKLGSGFSYRYDRLSLPLASDGRLRPMVLTFIRCDIPKAREFWERFDPPVKA